MTLVWGLGKPGVSSYGRRAAKSCWGMWEAAVFARDGGPACAILLAGRKDRQRVESKDKLDTTGPLPSVFHYLITKTFRWQLDFWF